jgi:hypothetical protein
MPLTALQKDVLAALARNRSEESHFAGGVVLNADDDSPRFSHDYVDIVELRRTYPLAAICWAACGKDPGFTPISLLKMMRRFARIDPRELDKIKARALDPVALKTTWTEMSDQAEVPPH